MTTIQMDLPQRAVGRSSEPAPHGPVVSLAELNLIRAVLDGLRRLDSGVAR